MVIHYSHNVYLIVTEINTTIIEVKTTTENFCKDLKEHVMKVANFKRLKMLPLTEEENKSRTMQKPVIYAKIDFNINEEK